MKNYLKTKCEENNYIFWNTVKPLLSENIILSENSKIINNQKDISEIRMTIILSLQKILDIIKILMLQNTLALLKLNNTQRATIFSFIIRQDKRRRA